MKQIKFLAAFIPLLVLAACKKDKITKESEVTCKLLSWVQDAGGSKTSLNYSYDADGLLQNTRLTQSDFGFHLNISYTITGGQVTAASMMVGDATHTTTPYKITFEYQNGKLSGISEYMNDTKLISDVAIRYNALNQVEEIRTTAYHEESTYKTLYTYNADGIIVKEESYDGNLLTLRSTIQPKGAGFTSPEIGLAKVIPLDISLNRPYHLTEPGEGSTRLDEHFDESANPAGEENYTLSVTSAAGSKQMKWVSDSGETIIEKHTTEGCD